MATLPLPVPNEETQAFWDYCKAGELRAQRCTACDDAAASRRDPCARSAARYRLRMAAPQRQGHDLQLQVTHQAVHHALEGQTPHPPSLCSSTRDRCSRATSSRAKTRVAIGLPVEVVFVQVTDEITLPKFRLV